MQDKCDLITVKANLANACDALEVGYWSERNYHVQRARNSLIKAICCDNTATLDDLADMLGEAFMDGQDIDATTRSIGMCAVRAILDSMAPEFPESQEEAA